MALVYSCCFWFSLRLGGILIAIFSMLQGLGVLIACGVAYSNTTHVKNRATALINSMNLIYVRTYVEHFQEDPEKYLSIVITFTCTYIFICSLYLYGAYMFKNILMIPYILLELLRLISMAFGITTWLFVLKENTMDIGIHIGTSVAGSFFLLGMFYLWVCTANLPILVNEMERYQQAATIHKLQQMLEMNNSSRSQGLATDGATLDGKLNPYRKPMFLVTSYQRDNQMVQKGSHNSVQSYFSKFNR